VLAEARSAAEEKNPQWSLQLTDIILDSAACNKASQAKTTL